MRRPEIAATLTLALALVWPGPRHKPRLRPRIVNGVQTAQFPTVGALLDRNDLGAEAMVSW